MEGTKLSTQSAQCKYIDKHKETAKEKKCYCQIQLVSAHCMELWGSVSGAKVLVCNLQHYQAELTTKYLLSAAYGNPICFHPTVYDLFVLQVLKSAQGSVKQTQNPFIGWKSHSRGESQPSQKSYYLVCHTGRASNHEVIIHVFNYDNHIIRKKWWNQSECQQKRTKAEKAKPHWWDILNISMLTKTCSLKLSAIYRNKTSIQHLD